MSQISTYSVLLLDRARTMLAPMRRWYWGVKTLIPQMWLPKHYYTYAMELNKVKPKLQNKMLMCNNNRKLPPSPSTAICRPKVFMSAAIGRHICHTKISSANNFSQPISWSRSTALMSHIYCEYWIFMCHLGGKAISEDGPASRVLLRKEVLRLIINLSSSVGTKGHETGLLT